MRAKPTVRADIHILVIIFMLIRTASANAVHVGVNIPRNIAPSGRWRGRASNTEDDGYDTYTGTVVA